MISNMNEIFDDDLYHFQVFSGIRWVMGGVEYGRGIRKICVANVGNDKFSFRALCIREATE